jgi:hypothetical protein
MAEWQRLTQLYREMGDGELEALDADKGDLTEVARQVLSDEIRKRGLDKPDKPGGPNNEADAAKRFGISPRGRDGDLPAGEDAAEESNPLVEYTWKTPLCECDDPEKAWQIQEVLRQAGIESWLDRWAYNEASVFGDQRIMVAADQLEKAHEVISQPIPQEIVEQSKMPIEEYVPPVCPSCGAADPILESAEPVNSWRCESCGRQWSEQAEDSKECLKQQP